MLAVAAVFAATVFAGCGDDDEPTTNASSPAGDVIPKATQSPEEVKISKTEKGQWAKRVCAVIAENSKPVTPPDVQAKDPAKVQESLETFFVAVGDQLEGQADALAEIEDPPGGGSAAKAWAKAQKNLAETEQTISKVQRTIAAAKVASTDDQADLMGKLGEQMQSVTSYEGVVADMLKNKAIRKAFAAEPSCRAIGGVAAGAN